MTESKSKTIKKQKIYFYKTTMLIYVSVKWLGGRIKNALFLNQKHYYCNSLDVVTDSIIRGQ